MQSRLESFVEAWINVFIGFGINFVANLVILPQFGFNTLTLQANFLIGICFTVVSVVRQYAIRRWAQAHLRRLVKYVAQRIRNYGYR